MYQLESWPQRTVVARGSIKDHPTAAEAVERLLERVGTAVLAELRELDDPAPWKVVLSCVIQKQA